MMFLKSSEKLAKKMIAISRDFLWGHNPEGGKQIPLVAWERLTRPKIEGGIGFKDFLSHSDALLNHWFTRALDHPDSDWARLFGINLKASTWINSRIIRRNNYSNNDIMLLLTPRAFPSLSYTGSIWHAWTPLRAHLLLSPGQLSIPGHRSIFDSLRCSKGLQSLSDITYQAPASMWGRLGVRNIIKLKIEKKKVFEFPLPSL